MFQEFSQSTWKWSNETRQNIYQNRFELFEEGLL